jgi:hypothetical protein
MRALPVLAFLATIAAASAASAQGSDATGLGIGAQSTLTGLSGPTVTYQTPQFHVEGILGFFDNDAVTEYDIAGRFFWEVHSTAASDLSIGGGLGIQSVDLGPETDNDIHIEVGARIRAFVAENVALGATLGLGLESGEDNEDDDVVFLNGQLVGAIGVTYFFF